MEEKTQEKTRQERTKGNDLLQWHPAFYAGIQVEFVGEREKMIFENEHQLGTKPKEIDVLIIKKDAGVQIEKNIGRIFRKHNIVEYKSPEDYLSIDDFYKVCGYACFYKADTLEEDEIKAHEITVTYVCKKYPRKVMGHLRTKRHLRVTRQEAGIYYVSGSIFPIQIIITSKLSKEHNFWLRNLTNDIKDSKVAAEVVEEYRKHQENRLYQSVMDMIVRANEESFEEVKGMCQALKELFKDELDAIIKEEVAAGIEAGVAAGIEAGIAARLEVNAKMVTECVTRQVTQQVTQQVTRQKIWQSMQKIMKNLQMTAEQAMDILEIPIEERKLYI